MRKVTVNSCKFDGQIHRSWHTLLLKREDTLIVLEGIFSEEVQHPILGTITKGTISTEYFWTDRWYGIFIFREKTGKLRNFYCNINTPPRLEDDILTFVDLDIDVLVDPDFSFQILDSEEFRENALLYKYPPALKARVDEALNEIISLIKNREFPFSHDNYSL